jgi:DNA polymerase-3 subunit epsilon
MNFVAIDFETATPDRASACSVGLVVVEDGKIVDRFSTYIRPINPEFSPRQIAIHGITPNDVAGKPTFQETWPQISQRIGSKLLVAHNAPFDVGVLHHCLAQAKLPSPQIKCICTLSMVRKLLPGLQDRRLPTLASLFGIAQDHHNAAADAATCAELAILLGKLAEPAGLSSFARDFAEFCSPKEETGPRVGSRGTVSIEFGIVPIQAGDVHYDEIENASHGQPVQPDAVVANLVFVFTGELSTITRDQAESLVKDRGWRAASSVSAMTNYVVVGKAVLDAYRRTGHTTGKLARAVALGANGANVKIIGEDEFLAMIE